MIPCTSAWARLQAVKHNELDVIVALADQQLAEAVGSRADGCGRLHQSISLVHTLQW